MEPNQPGLPTDIGVARAPAPGPLRGSAGYEFSESENAVVATPEPAKAVSTVKVDTVGSACAVADNNGVSPNPPMVANAAIEA